MPLIGVHEKQGRMLTLAAARQWMTSIVVTEQARGWIPLGLRTVAEDKHDEISCIKNSKISFTPVN